MLSIFSDNLRLKSLAIIYIALHFHFGHANCFVEFTNIQYYTVDKDFADFEYCYLKSVNRTYKYASLKLNLFQLPINNLSVSLEVKKRANGYKPFLYNFTVDACKFFKQKRNNPVYNYFYGFIETYSNLNHTCPYNHDLIIDKVDMNMADERVTKLLPVPRGDYGVFIKWIFNNKIRAHVNAFATLG